METWKCDFTHSGDIDRYLYDTLNGDSQLKGLYYLSADTEKWVKVSYVTDEKDKGDYNWDDAVYVGRVIAESGRRMLHVTAHELNHQISDSV